MAILISFVIFDSCYFGFPMICTLGSPAGRHAGRSANVIATELLEQGAADESSDARATLRGRARRFGVPTTAATLAVSATDREAAVNSARGIGPVLDELLADGR